MIADVRLQLLKSGQRSLKSGTRVHLYHGAAELVCKIILFDRVVLKPGEEAIVQLRMEQVTAMKAGDHFVIRFYSPVETIGGGVVLNPNGVKRKKDRMQMLLFIAHVPERKEKSTRFRKNNRRNMWEFCLFAAAGIISEIGLYASSDR